MSRRAVLRIATRGSRLALAQSLAVARRIEECLGVGTKLVEIRTTAESTFGTGLNDSFGIINAYSGSARYCTIRERTP